jgi:5-(carboxyamino)imidazole ribonucleotide synthase
MVNLLGDLWTGVEPRWAKLLDSPRIKLHLYGKHKPRPGRKMGHFNCLAPSAGKAETEARRRFRLLAPRKSARR